MGEKGEGERRSKKRMEEEGRREKKEKEKEGEEKRRCGAPRNRREAVAVS